VTFDLGKLITFCYVLVLLIQVENAHPYPRHWRHSTLEVTSEVTLPEHAPVWDHPQQSGILNQSLLSVSEANPQKALPPLLYSSSGHDKS